MSDRLRPDGPPLVLLSALDQSLYSALARTRSHAHVSHARRTGGQRVDTRVAASFSEQDAASESAMVGWFYGAVEHGSAAVRGAAVARAEGAHGALAWRGYFLQGS